MNKRHLMVLAGVLSLASACNTDKFLDVNTNPNAPQVVSANLYLAPMIHWMVTSEQFDGRFTGHYNQEWYSTSNVQWGTWGRMGNDQGSVNTGGAADNGGQQWRDVYWSLGQNLVDMMDKSRAEQRWDLLGVGYVLKAWGWSTLTDLHGELPIKEAFNQGATFSFNYDSQQFAYEETQRMLDSAIVYLQRTDGAVDATYLGKTDKLFNGDRTRWLKLAYGMYAKMLNHYSNKAAYNPTAIVANVDKSFTSQADEAFFVYPNVSADNTDRNFLGTTRSNFGGYRQTQFVVNLMNGTALGPVDPRMSRMLAASPDGQYRGLDINVLGFGALSAAQQPMNLYGYVTTPPANTPGRYLFSDKAKFPVMTYAQLQFIKAEALYRAGDKTGALAAYRNGITAHFAFVNARNAEEGFNTTQISTTERDTYLNDVRISPPAANLTLTLIMTQKYIAQWAWAHNEIWMDLRRFHYTDLDPSGLAQVFPGYAPPNPLYLDNNGKVAYRIRPRFNSEYVWNRPGLDAVGGLAADYQTKPLWIIQP